MRKLLLPTVLIVAFMLPSVSSAAIAYSTSSSTFANPTSSLAIPITVSGDNPIVIVSAMTNSATNNVTGVTCNGVALTKINEILQTAQNYFISDWYLTGISQGTCNVLISASASQYMEGMAAIYTGAATTQLRIVANSTTAQASGVTGKNFSASATENNSLGILDAIANQVLSPGTNTIERQEVTTNNPGHTFNEATSTTNIGAATTTVLLGGTGTVAGIMTFIEPFVASAAAGGCHIRGHGRCH